MSLGDVSECSTVVGSPVTVTFPARSTYSNSNREGSSTQISTGHESNTTSTNRQLKVWGSRNGKSASKVLFPDAKPTPVPSEFSVAAHDEAMEQSHGLNIMRTRFWDPKSSDWNPERFYDAVVCKYNCPFICE